MDSADSMLPSIEQDNEFFPIPAWSEPARKLVSARRISEMRTAPNGGKACHIDGWVVVVEPHRKKLFKVGDFVLFIEIDAFIPTTGCFWDFDSSCRTFCRGREGFRVRSKVYDPGSVLSQGCIYPLKHFPEIWVRYQGNIEKYGEEQATEDLLSRSFARFFGVTKWELDPQALEGTAIIGSKPSFIRLPGWHRIQDIEANIFSDLRKPPHLRRVWQVTEKLDGLSTAIYCVRTDSQWAATLPTLPEDYRNKHEKDMYRFGISDRKADYLNFFSNPQWAEAAASNVLKSLGEISRRSGFVNLAVVGEFVGHDIMKNTMGYPEGKHEFFAFDVCDIDTGNRMTPQQTEELCKDLNINFVPVLGYCTLDKCGKNTQELLSMAEEDVSRISGKLREGLVFKSIDGKHTAFKVISNKWLTQVEE
ncbi:RNA ligase-domain-containing protein [Podospora australis]|uniref:RNA ligase-domain-containing protein n=1 Tax=Podospora australis TaxID=1536484 RepID=A0AAN7APF8_9PEZI|nr:RNA ligase-domain-containing protein [Podospora australis]